MLDTEACRLDVAEIVRLSKRTPDGVTRWTNFRVETGRYGVREVPVLDFVIRHDPDRDVLVVDEELEVDLERVRVRVPSCGRIVPGPVLARCPRGCGRRARVLWVDLGAAEVFPVCRECAGVEYVTAKTGELERARIAHSRLRRRLGLSRHAGHEPRPYQRRRAYERDAARLADARARELRAERREWESLARRLGRADAD